MKQRTNMMKQMKMTIVALLCLSASLLSCGCVSGRLEFSLHMQVSDETVRVGDELVYTIVLTNTYNNTGTLDVTQTFSLPVEILTVSIDPSDAVCHQDNNTITCEGIPLGAGAVQAFMTVSVRPTTVGNLTSTATLNRSGIDYPGFRASDSATTAVVLNCCADLSISMTDDIDPVAAGDDLTYTITVTNNGQDTATEVGITDTLTTPIEAIQSPYDCRQLAWNRLSCDFGSLASGESRVVTVSVRPTQPGVLTNTANLTTSTFDPNRGNDSATELTTVMPPGADLVVTMTDNPDPVAPGNDVTYIVQVINKGPATATNVFLKDDLPTNGDLVSIIPSQGSCPTSGSFRTCNLGSMASDAHATLTVVVRSSATGSLKNTASITADQNDPNTENNAFTENTIVGRRPPIADLSISVTDLPDPVAVDRRTVIANTVHHNDLGSSGDDATNIVCTVDFSAQVVWDGPIGQVSTCTTIGDRTVCQFPLPNLASGESYTLTIGLVPTATGTLTYTASVLAAEEDPNPTNNSVTKTTTVISPAADLSVTISDSPDPVLVGNDLTYLITTRNNGPSAATGITLTDTLPSGVDFVSATSGQGSCTLLSSTVTCHLSPGPADPVCPDCAIVTIVVRPMTAGPISNTASVAALESDPNSSNNTATENTTVTSLDADLVVTMTDNPDPVAVNNNVVYAINVVNNGPETANNVFMADTLPADSSVISITPSQGSCDPFGAFRICYLGSIASGAGATVSVVVSPRSAGTISNTVIAGASENDPDFANNSATETTTVNQPLAPDLSVTVSDLPDPVAENQQLTYTVTVSNNGLGEANGPTIRATLPSSVTVNFPGDFNCSPSGGNLVCQTPALGRLPSGTHLSETLVVTPSVPGTITNTVHVTSSGTDANPADNTIAENTTVSPSVHTADVSIAISDSADPVVIDQPLTYAITVRNNGLATATGIIVTATLPTNFNYTGLLCPFIGADRKCEIRVPDLANGGSSVLTLEGLPTAVGTISLAATVSAAEDDPDLSNNSATETTNVVPPQMTADLEIVSVSSSPNPAIVNQQFVYTVVVRNNGLGAATNIMVTNTLDAGLVYDGSQGCFHNGQIVQCGFGNFPAGATTTISFLAHASVAGSLRNVVGVTAQELDPNLLNNSFTETTTIYPADSADLVMSIAAVPNQVTIPNEVTFTLLVQNTGPAAAAGVTLTGFSFASLEQLEVTPTQGTCSFAPYPLLTCNIGALASGGSAIVTIRGATFDLGILTQTVTATSSNDPNAANNTATVTVTVNPPETASVVSFTRGQRDHRERVEVPEVEVLCDLGGKEMMSNATRAKE